MGDGPDVERRSGLALSEALRLKRLVEQAGSRCLVARLAYAEGEGYTVLVLDVCAGRSVVLRHPDDWRHLLPRDDAGTAEAGGWHLPHLALLTPRGPGTTPRSGGDPAHGVPAAHGDRP